ncbi:MAG: hypothetical protein HYX82_05775 [Chloroflexi bacterium]|nr:hypothetical protein [Chloroflexota bacterium]
MAQGTISDDFISLHMYSVYRALTEVVGEENAWKVVWRTGEIAFEEIAKRTGLDKKERDPKKVVRTMGQFFEQSGYIERLEGSIVDGGKGFQIDLINTNPAIRGVGVQLKAENCVPHRWGTVSIRAALADRCGLLMSERPKKVESIGPGSTRTHWSLEPKKS